MASNSIPADLYDKRSRSLTTNMNQAIQESHNDQFAKIEMFENNITDNSPLRTKSDLVISNLLCDSTSTSCQSPKSDVFLDNDLLTNSLSDIESPTWPCYHDFSRRDSCGTPPLSPYELDPTPCNYVKTATSPDHHHHPALHNTDLQSKIAAEKFRLILPQPSINFPPDPSKPWDQQNYVLHSPFANMHCDHDRKPHSSSPKNNPASQVLNTIRNSECQSHSNKTRSVPSETAFLTRHSWEPYSNTDGSIVARPKRRRANARQLEVLNQAFQQTLFPPTEMRIHLGRELGMSPRTVQIWFQNKRQSLRSRPRVVGVYNETSTNGGNQNDQGINSNEIVKDDAGNSHVAMI